MLFLDKPKHLERLPFVLATLLTLWSITVTADDGANFCEKADPRAEVSTETQINVGGWFKTLFRITDAGLEGNATRKETMKTMVDSIPNPEVLSAYRLAKYLACEEMRQSTMTAEQKLEAYAAIDREYKEMFSRASSRTAAITVQGTPASVTLPKSGASNLLRKGNLQRVVVVPPFENVSSEKQFVRHEIRTEDDQNNPKRTFDIDRYAESSRAMFEDLLSSISQ